MSPRPCTGRRAARTLALAAAAMLSLSAGSAAAAVLQVRPDGKGPFATIQAALDAAQAGDTIALAAGRYAGPGNVDLDFRGKAVVLLGNPADPGAVIIDCAQAGGHHRALRFLAGESPTTAVRGLTMTGGLAADPAGPEGMGGAVLCVGSSPEMSDCILGGNWAHTGGAVALQNSDAVFLRCRFLRNTAEIGGAVSVEGGSPALLDCILAGNTAARGGAVAAFGCRLGIAGCVLRANSATLGGAVAAAEGAALDVRGTVVDANYASAGGALHLQGGTLSLVRCTLVLNSAGTGGGLFLDGDARAGLAGSIIAHGVRGQAVVAAPTCALDFACCVLWGNGGGDWTGPLAQIPGRGGNLAADPRLTDLPAADYAPLPGSPCRGGPCGAIGAVE